MILTGGDKMLNYLWGGMIIISIITAVFNGTVKETTDALMNGACEAVTLTFSLMGVMCLWTGVMKIASDSGLIKYISKALRPVTKLLFPKIPPKSPAMDAIVMNITANIFGMSNAATPLGIKAVEEMAKKESKSYASDAMCMFIVLNTASVQLIPSTILALRSNALSTDTYAVIAPIWCASIVSLITGVIAVKIFERREG
jgi:spore maturation protein A